MDIKEILAQIESVTGDPNRVTQCISGLVEDVDERLLEVRDSFDHDFLYELEKERFLTDELGSMIDSSMSYYKIDIYSIFEDRDDVDDIHEVFSDYIYNSVVENF